MKKIVLGILLVVCLLGDGCGQARPTADEYVQAVYDLSIRGESQGALDLGFSQEKIAEPQNEYDEILAEAIRANFSASGLEIQEETIDTICQARKGALSRMEAECMITSQEGTNAIVTLSTTYFDEAALDADAYYDAREQARDHTFMDDDEQQAYIMECYTKNLIAGYNAVVPSEDTREITVECSYVRGMWMPNDMASFGNDLALAVAGQ